jgi:hypothetical protein
MKKMRDCFDSMLESDGIMRRMGSVMVFFFFECVLVFFLGGFQGLLLKRGRNKYLQRLEIQENEQ